MWVQDTEVQAVVRGNRVPLSERRQKYIENRFGSLNVRMLDYDGKTLKFKRDPILGWYQSTETEMCWFWHESWLELVPEKIPEPEPLLVIEPKPSAAVVLSIRF